MLKFTKPDITNPRYFFQLDTGQGKTALCYLLALRIVLEKRTRVFIVNKSKDLTFRDYRKAYRLAKNLNVRVILLEGVHELDKLLPGIHFTTSDDFA
jgi:hypothetical protein